MFYRYYGTLEFWRKILLVLITPLLRRDSAEFWLVRGYSWTYNGEGRFPSRNCICNPLPYQATKRNFGKFFLFDLSDIFGHNVWRAVTWHFITKCDVIKNTALLINTINCCVLILKPFTRPLKTSINWVLIPTGN